MSVTTGNTSQLRRSELWSASLKEILQDDLNGMGYVRWLSEFPDGDQFTIPSIGEATARDYAEDTAVVYDALDTGEFTFTITEYVQSGHYITKKAMQDTYYASQLTSAFVPKQSRAIAERLETDIFKLAGAGASGGQTAASTNSINGAEHRWVASGTDRGSNDYEIAIKDFPKAAFALKRANVPDTNLVAIVDPSVAYTFDTLTNLVNVSNNPRWEGVITTGMSTGMKFLKNIYGFDVYVSNYLTVGGANGGTSAVPAAETIGARTISTSGVVNIFMSAAGGDINPFVGAIRQTPEVDEEYNKDFQRYEYVTTARWGLKVYRPENLVTVLSSTAVVV